MGSLDREVRMRQKTTAEAKIEARLTKLKEAGLDEKRIARDPLLRQAKAELKETLIRLKAIDAREALIQTLAQKKEQGKSQPKEKGGAKSKETKDKGKPASKKTKKGEGE